MGQTGLLLGDSLFSKELENMGKQLAGRQSRVYVWVFSCMFCVTVCHELMCHVLFVHMNAFVLVTLMMNSMNSSDQIHGLEHAALTNTHALDYKAL